MAGDSAIFKRRGEEVPPLGFMQGLHPKRIHFVMDVSGSMYRFNGFDGRLDRMLETAALVCNSFYTSHFINQPIDRSHTSACCPYMQVMESFIGFEDKFRYSIGGPLYMPPGLGLSMILLIFEIS